MGERFQVSNTMMVLVYGTLGREAQREKRRGRTLLQRIRWPTGAMALGCARRRADHGPWHVERRLADKPHRTPCAGRLSGRHARQPRLRGELRCTDMKADGRNVASAVAQALLRRKVTSAYALEDMALDVERLLNHLSIRRAHIVGISMGGMIAQVAAVQSPNRVASLTSIASASGNPRTGFGRLNAVWTLLRKPDNLNTEEGLRLLRPRVHHPFRAGVQAVGRGTREHAGHAGEPALRS